MHSLPVIPTTPPEHDPETEDVLPASPVRGADGLFRQQWAVVPKAG